MKAHTEHQIIEFQGNPVAVILPFEDYLQLTQKPSEEYTIPHEVVEARVVKGFGTIKAWRLYRGLSQKAMAEKMGTSQSNYSQMESRPFYKLQTNSQRKLCAILGVSPAILADFEEIEL